MKDRILIGPIERSGCVGSHRGACEDVGCGSTGVDRTKCDAVELESDCSGFGDRSSFILLIHSSRALRRPPLNEEDDRRTDHFHMTMSGQKSGGPGRQEISQDGYPVTLLSRVTTRTGSPAGKSCLKTSPTAKRKDAFWHEHSNVSYAFVPDVGQAL